ncbi:MAG: hypothetical protein LBT09_04970 [Planctomycetaceae bacterium]|nr:hypothetical protein [Planctomycetaceae bacterium]
MEIVALQLAIGVLQLAIGVLQLAIGVLQLATVALQLAVLKVFWGIFFNVRRAVFHRKTAKGTEILFYILSVFFWLLVCSVVKNILATVKKKIENRQLPEMEST